VNASQLFTRKTLVNQRRGCMNPMIEAFDFIEAQVHQLIDLNSALRAQCASFQEQRQAQPIAQQAINGQREAELERALSDQTQVFAQQEQQLAELGQRLVGYEKIIAEQEQTIALNNQALRERDHAISERDHAISELEQGMRLRDQTIAERDQQIKEFRDRMNQAQQRVRKALEVLPPHTPDLFE